MNPNIDGQLRQAGVDDSSVLRRLDGPEKSFVITGDDLIYADALGLQRAPLRTVSKVVVDRSGALSVNSPGGPLIQTSVRGFDVAQLRFFFDEAKSAIARAKAGPAAPAPHYDEPATPPARTTATLPVESAPAAESTLAEPVAPVGAAPVEQPADPWALSDPLPLREPVAEAPMPAITPAPASPSFTPEPPIEVVDEPAAPTMVAAPYSPPSPALPVEEPPTRPRPADRSSDIPWAREVAAPAPVTAGPAVAVVGTPAMATLATLCGVVGVLGLVVGLVGAVLMGGRAQNEFDYLTVAAWAVGGLFALAVGLSVAAVLRALSAVHEH